MALNTGTGQRGAVPVPPWIQIQFQFDEGPMPNTTTRAIDRANDLLLENLTPEQYESVGKRAYFTVVGSEGNPYVIRTAGAVSGNVGWMPRGDADLTEISGWFCAYPFGVPQGDVYLAQKLCLESDEGRFLATAVVFNAGASNAFPPWYREVLEGWLKKNPLVDASELYGVHYLRQMMTPFLAAREPLQRVVYDAGQPIRYYDGNYYR